MLRHDDHQGYRTAGWSLAFVFAVFTDSLVPAFTNRVAGWYWPVAVAPGTMFSVASIRFWLRSNEDAARSLFFASLYYLPVFMR